MLDELEFRGLADSALEALKKHLILREEADDAGFEVEEQGGVLNVLFEEPPGKFVITPNTPDPPDLDIRPLHQLQARLGRRAQ